MRSWRISSTPRSRRWFYLLLAGLTLAVAVLSLMTGAVMVSPGEVIASLTGGDSASVAYRIVRFTRLPRTCAALLAGAALAVSGAIIQTVLNNPLASPGVIGVNSSAGLSSSRCSLVIVVITLSF